MDVHDDQADHAAPAIANVVVHTLAEWELCKEDKAATLLLQCGSPVCARCPAFTRQVADLKSKFQFTHVYVDTHDAEEDLIEELQVTKLPAYFIVKNDEAVSHAQSASPDQLTAAVSASCTPVFTQDADF
jgi:thiol-disulfide isomerase/thioredoxin